MCLQIENCLIELLITDFLDKVFNKVFAINDILNMCLCVCYKCLNVSNRTNACIS